MPSPKKNIAVRPPQSGELVRVGNELYVADNLNILRGLDSESVDLIYLDPPFNSKRLYAAPIGSAAEKKAAAKKKTAGFLDIWSWNKDVDLRLEAFLDQQPALFNYISVVGAMHSPAMKAYLTFMAQRLIELHRVLKPTGSFYLHCDPTANSYLRVLLDFIFGKNNMRNQIIWQYNKWTGGATKMWAADSDHILFYTKSDDYNFHPQYYDKETVGSKQGYLVQTRKNSRRLIIYEETEKNAPAIQKYTELGYRVSYHQHKGVSHTQTWQIPIAKGKERTGYPTQKPLALLRRIILASSNEGDVVLDPFCGCATTCVAAQQLGRRWIGMDISDIAVELVVDRLSEDGNGQRKMFTDFVSLTSPPRRSDVEWINLNNPREYQRVKRELYGEQEGHCNGCRKHFEMRNLEIDHIWPKGKDGGNYRHNLQLLCGGCNKEKGTKSMEYLRRRLAERNRFISERIAMED